MELPTLRPGLRRAAPAVQRLRSKGLAEALRLGRHSVLHRSKANVCRKLCWSKLPPSWPKLSGMAVNVLRRKFYFCSAVCLPAARPSPARRKSLGRRGRANGHRSERPAK